MPSGALAARPFLRGDLGDGGRLADAGRADEDLDAGVGSSSAPASGAEIGWPARARTPAADTPRRSRRGTAAATASASGRVDAGGDQPGGRQPAGEPVPARRCRPADARVAAGRPRRPARPLGAAPSPAPRAARPSRASRGARHQLGRQHERVRARARSRIARRPRARWVGDNALTCIVSPASQPTPPAPAAAPRCATARPGAAAPARTVARGAAAASVCTRAQVVPPRRRQISAMRLASRCACAGSMASTAPWSVRDDRRRPAAPRAPATAQIAGSSPFSV